MYLFYQKSGGREAWKYVEDNKQNRDMLAQKGVAFIAALSISDPEQTDYEKVKYKGDLYFDIDSEDLSESIAVAQNLLKKLRRLGVQDYAVYLSGKKGLHLTVPAKVFSRGGQVKYLPYIYGKMAEKMDVAGLDFAVYSGGKGRLWRQQNVLRPETNTFKVEIDPDSLLTLTEEKYRILVSSPSPVLQQAKDPHKSLELAEMYEYCKTAVEAEESAKEKYEFEAIPELQELTEVPGCIKKLITSGDEKQNSNFNKAAMQLAGYIKSSGLDAKTISEVVSTMAKNVKSGTYDTYKKRVQHIKSQLARAKHDPRMGFSPGYLFSTVTPCGDCILCNGSLDKYYGGLAKEGNEVDGCPVFEAEGRYWIRRGKFDYPITTFTIKPVMFSEVLDQNTGIAERESTTLELHYHHLGEDKKYSRNLDERCWDSVSSFKKAISGIDNIIYRGGESDLQDLKHFIFSQDVQMGKITKLKSCGISPHKINSTGKTILVYTEPNYSIDIFGEENTHEVYSTIHSPPRVFTHPDLDGENETHVQLAKELCNINHPYQMAQILGWFTICHFKPHVMACEKQFPVLGIWGNAGSGKSKTASVMAYLHGCDFEGADSVVTCGGSTPWSLASYVSTSTSTPRLLDEFNHAKINKWNYQKIVDLLKGCFNEQSMTKGQLAARGNGAEIAETKLTGPVCVMAEQYPGHEAALIQRMVTVQLSRRTRVGCEESWDFVYNNRHQIPSIAKALVLTALKTPKKVIKYWMEEFRSLLPSETIIDSRPHFSLRAVLTGLKMYELTLQAYGIDVSKEVKVLQNALVNRIDEHVDTIAQVNNHSVVDKMLDMLAQMAADAAKDENRRTGMLSGVAYSRDDIELLIDVEGIYGQYRIYTRNLGEPAVIPNYREFKELVQEEPYFIGEVFAEELTASRNVLAFSVEGLRRKGVAVNLFEKVD